MRTLKEILILLFFCIIITGCNPSSMSWCIMKSTEDAITGTQDDSNQHTTSPVTVLTNPSTNSSSAWISSGFYAAAPTGGASPTTYSLTVNATGSISAVGAFGVDPTNTNAQNDAFNDMNTGQSTGYANNGLGTQVIISANTNSSSNPVSVFSGAQIPIGAYVYVTFYSSYNSSNQSCNSPQSSWTWTNYWVYDDFYWDQGCNSGSGCHHDNYEDNSYTDYYSFKGTPVPDPPCTPSCQNPSTSGCSSYHNKYNPCGTINTCWNTDGTGLMMNIDGTTGVKFINGSSAATSISVLLADGTKQTMTQYSKLLSTGGPVSLYIKDTVNNYANSALTGQYIAYVKTTPVVVNATDPTNYLEACIYDYTNNYDPNNDNGAQCSSIQSNVQVGSIISVDSGQSVSFNISNAITSAWGSSSASTSSGSYQVNLSYQGSDSDSGGAFSSFIQSIIDLINNTVSSAAQGMFANLTCYAGGDGAAAVNPNCTDYIGLVRIVLILYIIFYSISFLFGIVQASQEDLVWRVLKIGLIICLIRNDSWTFFNTYCFNTMTTFGNQLIVQMSGNMYTGENTFAFLDTSVSLTFLNIDNFLRAIAMLFSGIAGFILFLLLFYGLFVFAKCIFSIVKAYVLNLVTGALLISLAPIFIPFLLFEVTKGIATQWFKSLLRTQAEPMILIFGTMIINTMLIEQLQTIFNYSLCLKCAINISIPNIGPLVCLPGLMPWGVDNQSSNSLFQSGYVSLGTAMSYWMLINLMKSYVDTIGPGIITAIMGVSLHGGAVNKAAGNEGMWNKSSDPGWMGEVIDAIGKRAKNSRKGGSEPAAETPTKARPVISTATHKEFEIKGGDDKVSSDILKRIESLRTHSLEKNEKVAKAKADTMESVNKDIAEARGDSGKSLIQQRLEALKEKGFTGKFTPPSTPHGPQESYLRPTTHQTKLGATGEVDSSSISFQNAKERLQAKLVNDPNKAKEKADQIKKDTAGVSVKARKVELAEGFKINKKKALGESETRAALAKTEISTAEKDEGQTSLIKQRQNDLEAHKLVIGGKVAKAKEDTMESVKKDIAEARGDSGKSLIQQRQEALKEKGFTGKLTPPSTPRDPQESYLRPTTHQTKLGATGEVDSSSISFQNAQEGLQAKLVNDPNKAKEKADQIKKDTAGVSIEARKAELAKSFELDKKKQTDLEENSKASFEERKESMKGVFEQRKQEIQEHLYKKADELEAQKSQRIEEVEKTISDVTKKTDLTASELQRVEDLRKLRRYDRSGFKPEEEEEVNRLYEKYGKDLNKLQKGDLINQQTTSLLNELSQQKKVENKDGALAETSRVQAQPKKVNEPTPEPTLSFFGALFKTITENVKWGLGYTKVPNETPPAEIIKNYPSDKTIIDSINKTPNIKTSEAKENIKLKLGEVIIKKKNDQSNS